MGEGLGVGALGACPPIYDYGLFVKGLSFMLNLEFEGALKSEVSMRAACGTTLWPCPPFTSNAPKWASPVTKICMEVCRWIAVVSGRCFDFGTRGFAVTYCLLCHSNMHAHASLKV